MQLKHEESRVLSLSLSLFYRGNLESRWESRSGIEVWSLRAMERERSISAISFAKLPGLL